MTTRVINALTGAPLASSSVFASDADGVETPGGWTALTDDEGYVTLSDAPVIEYYTFRYLGLAPRTYRRGEVPSAVGLDESVDTWLPEGAGATASAPVPASTRNYMAIAGVIVILIAIIGGVVVYLKNRTVRG